MWPASLMRAASVSPDVSLDASRVSETVSTAMRTGTKATVSSMRCEGIADDQGSGRLFWQGRRPRRNRRACMISRPQAFGRFVERRRTLLRALGVHPVIGHHIFDVAARF